MILTVSSASAPLRSTQNTCAPARAKVTAVALPLPQPGPIEPAPTTIAVLPSRRFTRSLPFFVGREIGCTYARGQPPNRGTSNARSLELEALSLVETRQTGEALLRQAA